MIELFIFDQQLNLQNEISEYINIEIERKGNAYSQLVLDIQATDNTIGSLVVNNIITTQSNTSYGYIIQHIEYTQSSQETLRVVAFSLNYILTFRSIYPQQVFNGKHEDAIRYFVSRNCIDTNNPNRKIPMLSLGQYNNIGSSSTFIRTGGDLLEYVLSIANEVGATIDILIDHSSKSLFLIVTSGTDRSASQSANPRVMFSEDFDNILTQNYFLSFIDYKNAAVIAGEGEGEEREIVDVNPASGLQRRELYVDARDLQSTYQDDNNQEVTIPPQQYTDALISRGNEALLEVELIETFEADVDNTQFIYGVDYFVGDTVSVKNLRLNLTVDVKVSSVKITSNSSGVKVVPQLGTALPNLYRLGGR